VDGSTSSSRHGLVVDLGTAEVGDDLRRDAQPQRQDPREVAQHRVGELRRVREQDLEGGHVATSTSVTASSVADRGRPSKNASSPACTSARPAPIRRTSACENTVAQSPPSRRA
jgi:hypothetical protein